MGAKTSKSFYNLEKDGITQGLLMTWLACRKKARWFLQGYSPKSVSMGLTFGTIVHGINEYAYASIHKGSLKTVPSSQLVRTYIKQVEAQWRLDNPRADKSSLENLELALLIAEATMPLYFDYWKKDLKEIKWSKG